jgi:hypothetical protein
LCDHVVEFGKLDMLQWIISQDPMCASDSLYSFAFICGNVDILEWLRGEKGADFSKEISLDTITLSFAHGRQRLLKWLFLHYRTHFLSCYNSEKTYWDNVSCYSDEIHDWLVGL